MGSDYTVGSHDSGTISVFSTLDDVNGGLVRSRGMSRKRTDAGQIPAALGLVIRSFERGVNTLWCAKWSKIWDIIGTNLTFNQSRPRRRPGEAPGACAVSVGWVRVTPAPQMWSYHPVKGWCEHLPPGPLRRPENTTLGGCIIGMSLF